MIKIRLCAAEVINKMSGRSATKETEWPVVPSQGQYVGIRGNLHEVERVEHNMDKSNSSIDVWFDFDQIDFVELLSDPKWKLT